ncbi:hypothetical protein BH18CHL2_BH18CHL2_01640 [soil metagenome]
MRPPYPAEIPPLLAQFLTRRRAKLDHPQRAAAALGIDRAAFILATALPVTAPDGATADDLASPYAVQRDAQRGALAAAKEAGLVEEEGGMYRATGRAVEHAKTLQRAAHAHLATLEPIPGEELTRLADRLEQAFQASAAAAPTVPRAHTPRAFRFREGSGTGSPMVVLENAVYGLWMVRDDCHVAAWLSRGLAGPDLDVLTRLWRAEADTPAALAERLGHSGTAHVERSLATLRTGGLVEPAACALTSRGRSLRDAVERETDELFFSPWPLDVGADAGWIQRRLAEVNAALV